jgi:hypothetical protein
MNKFFVLILLVAFLPQNAFAAVDNHTATLSAQIMGETSQVSLEGREDASAAFSFGEETILFVNFEEPVQFVSNIIRIDTDVAVIGTADAHSTIPRILELRLDGVTMDGVYFDTQQNEDGFLSLEVFGTYPSLLYEARPFSMLEVQFEVGNAPRNLEDPPPEIEPISAEIDTEEETETEAEPEEETETPALSANLIIGIIVALAAGVGVVVYSMKKGKS